MLDYAFLVIGEAVNCSLCLRWFVFVE